MDQVLLLCTGVLVIVNGAMVDYIIKCWSFREIVFKDGIMCFLGCLKLIKLKTTISDDVR